MIVTATSDLVLDVLDAADPVAQRTATAKLEALRSSDADFAATMDAAASKAADQSSAGAAEAQSGVVNGPPVQVIKKPGPDEVYRKFEAFILQTFVETMLPKESEEVFGKGTAGGIWKSMLAEQLGNQLAKGKGIGIAKQLASAHPAGPDMTGKAGDGSRNG
ncbi:rod-binding protein [Bradyrhizobium sp. GCM10027634]|uniref:rod-binding protein n=1 Tax=unclassified Bradyrhizobium TaxID=2631580 RepID=UPI00188AE389|nr:MULTISPECIES: rod-binding protein [unclassified Bradyrhizobium]MDN4999793.1 rod-binding protein [Bradyrhizobium sp. WYCCWR 12677]QOZ43306.1 rod-binding protein [Bradyrhizobium sp. CCBAU 53340]